MTEQTSISNAPVRAVNFFRSNLTTSWLYPFKGLVFFLRDRRLWPLLRTRLVPLALLSLCVTIILFMTVYLPQVALLYLFHERGSAWVSGTFLVLGETNLVVAMLFEALLVDNTQVTAFDAVMIIKGHSDLVKTRRAIDPEEPDPVKCLGPRDKGAEFSPFSLRQIIEFIFLLPLNFVPFVGVPLFLFATGYRAGPLLQWRYYQLKGFDKQQRKTFISSKSRRWQYTWFGTAHLLLQLVPVLSLLFLITTAIGSALWAADQEDALTQHPQDEHEDLEDNPPPYTDQS